MIVDPFGSLFSNSYDMVFDKAQELSNSTSFSDNSIKVEKEVSETQHVAENGYDLPQFETFGYVLSSDNTSKKRTYEDLSSTNRTFQGTADLSVAQLDSISNKRHKGQKKGSVISPEDREPPTEEEVEFFLEHTKVLHNLLAYNMQYLAFFPQHQWRDEFEDAVQTQNSVISSTIFNQLGSAQPLYLDESEAKQEIDPAQVFDEFLLEPANEHDPFVNVTFAPEPPQHDVNDSDGTNRRRRTSMRYMTRNATSATGFISSPGISLLELMTPKLSEDIKHELENLTTFQKNLARNKCREVLGFYKLMLRNRKASKLVSAQVMENSSRFVVRTILNWAREYYKNQGFFNRSKIGKHKRVSLIQDSSFQTALKSFATEQGDAISVDSASQFIKRFHKEKKEEGVDLPGPPSSRATVHRWLKMLNIKLGPRGKKRSSRG